MNASNMVCHFREGADVCCHGVVCNRHDVQNLSFHDAISFVLVMASLFICVQSRPKQALFLEYVPLILRWLSRTALVSCSLVRAFGFATQCLQ